MVGLEVVTDGELRLDFVLRQHVDQPDVFEITQLWNSLSGLLVLPYEREVDEIKASLAEAVDRGNGSGLLI